MAKVVQKTEKPLYRVHCTECGEVIDNKFFPLHNLLKQYHVGERNETSITGLVDFLGIGALYGQTVLPNVPAFTDGKGNWHFDKPASFVGKTLPEFICHDNEIPENKLEPINLNIASMVAQFCMITGFDDIYPMLKLRQEMDVLAANFAQPTAEQSALWDTYCDRISQIPGVKVDRLTSPEVRKTTIAKIMSDILRFADEEARMSAKRHFAHQGFKVGWRYKIVNDRKLPFALVVRGGLEGIFDVQDCCCDKCRKPLSWEMGAYQQKVIGILGTQAVGKTTYLMALADVIAGVEFKNMTITHDSADPQWKRVEKEAKPKAAKISTETHSGNDAWSDLQQEMTAGPNPGNTKAGSAGLLWRYQNGCSPDKTQVSVGEAPVLTFKVQKNKSSEPVMYALADIPGEVFYDPEDTQYPQDLIEAIKRLLLASDSLILVVKSDQLHTMDAEQNPNPSDNTKKSKLVKNSSQILTAFKEYLPEKPISTAVVLTAADNLGDLRELFGLAFDIRKLQPLVYSRKAGLYVYNAEAMNTACQAVCHYMDRDFKQFMHKLSNSFVPKGSAVTPFAVSSGTQCAVEFSAWSSEEKAKERYANMCKARFGIAAPLLWLLTCDGMLQKGRTDDYFDGYDDKYRVRILEEIARKES